MGVGVHFNELITSKIVIFSFITDGSLDFPWFNCGILESDLLGDLFSDHAIKFQLLNGFLRLWNAFTNQIYIKRVCSFNRAFDFEFYIVVRDIRVESYVEEQVLVR